MAEIARPSLPSFQMCHGEDKINLLNGYTSRMSMSKMQDIVTPIELDRKVAFYLNTFGEQIKAISFEVRSIDGERLVETGEVSPEDRISDDKVTSVNYRNGKYEFILKDLLDINRYYGMEFCLEKESGSKIYYYTRFIVTEEYWAKEKIEFVKDFHKKSINRSTVGELAMYMEPDYRGDNTTYAKVDIHSSLNQLSFGNLNVTEESEAIIQIKELSQETGIFTVRYRISISEERNIGYYNLTEYYRIRKGKERIYLLDFEREMERIFVEDDRNLYNNNKISLGIIGQDDVAIDESEGGNVMAFTVGNRLFCYNSLDNSMSKLYSTYEALDKDVRTLNDDTRVKILTVEETGSVLFIVYGYHSRGRHEGEVGIQVEYYDAGTGGIEERIFIKSDFSPSILMNEVERFSYANREGYFFTLLEGTIYRISLENHSVVRMISGMNMDTCQISEGEIIIAWSETEEEQDPEENGENIESESYSAEDRGTSIILENLVSGRRQELKAGKGEYIKPLGFMGDDLIYGICSKEDMELGNRVNVAFPMKSIYIQDDAGRNRMTYEKENIIVTGITIENNQITLKRMKKNGEDSLNQIEDDHIVSVLAREMSTNITEKAVTQNYETVMQIALKKNIDYRTMKLNTPGEILFEGGRNVSMDREENEIRRYYVYDMRGICSVTEDEARAVRTAVERMGYVVSESGTFIWKRGNVSTRNQIMSIKGGSDDEEKSSLAICLDTMLQNEGVLLNSEILLESSMTPREILDDNIKGIRTLQLSGCPLSALTYYLNEDIPVMAFTSQGGTLLITGYNDAEIVIMEPGKESVYKMRMSEAAGLFEKAGNRFLTYLRVEM